MNFINLIDVNVKNVLLEIIGWYNLIVVIIE